MKQLKPVYSKHVEDLITQLEDIMEDNEKAIFNNWEELPPIGCYKVSWDEYLNLNTLHNCCINEIQRIKDTQLPVFYELV